MNGGEAEESMGARSSDHPAHGIALRDACAQLGVPCELHHQGGPQPSESSAAWLERVVGE